MGANHSCGRVRMTVGVVLAVGLAAGMTPSGAARVRAAVPTTTPGAQGAHTPPPAVAPPEEFYASAGPVAPGPLGEVLASLELVAPEGLRQWAVLYRSTGLDGAPTAVSGVVLAPADPPASPRPVLALAHGTTGLADRCAPSRTGALEVLMAGSLFARDGWVVAATDYEGLGTPGPHPYVVGPSEGRSVLDAARAAAALPGTGAGDRVALMGISQGGHATLWANQVAPTYAPELDLVGAVAAAPAGDLAAIASWAAGPTATRDSWRNDLTVAAAWHEVFGLPVDELLTPAAQALLPGLQEQCTVMPDVAPLAADPSSIPEWAARLAENSPGTAAGAAPILYLQGTADEQIPVESARDTVARLCASGNAVDYRELPGVDHVGSLYGDGRPVLARDWLAERPAGMQATSTCGG